MNVKIISIEKTEANKREHKVEFSLNNEPKTAMLIELKDKNEEYKVILDEEIKIGELEGLVKQMVILTFKESKGE
jgi:hypothetical protein